MIIWGGAGGPDDNDGGSYDPVANSWTPTSTVDAPTARIVHSAVWTGTEMLVWGGENSIGPINNGGRYNPAFDSWAPLTTVGAPSGRFNHTALWTGNAMLIWGGQGNPGDYSDPYSYTPSRDLYLYLKP
jgi:hypothetical protein